MIIVGLTGSIGMGKSTAARLLEAEGVPVCDSDALVHALYERELPPLLCAAFPDCCIKGRVNRAYVRQKAIKDPHFLTALEEMVHPLVRQQQDIFLKHHQALGTPIVVLDIPLLFETGADKRVDYTLVVSAPEDIQRARVLARPGMTLSQFEALLRRQMPDPEKRARADVVLETGQGIDVTRDALRLFLKQLAAEGGERLPHKSLHPQG